jgi:hypothetical protein
MDASVLQVEEILTRPWSRMRQARSFRMTMDNPAGSSFGNAMDEYSTGQTVGQNAIPDVMSPGSLIFMQ